MSVALPRVTTYFGIGWKISAGPYCWPDVSAQVTNGFSSVRLVDCVRRITYVYVQIGYAFAKRLAAGRIHDRELVRLRAELPVGQRSRPDAGEPGPCELPARFCIEKNFRWFFSAYAMSA